MNRQIINQGQPAVAVLDVTAERMGPDGAHEYRITGAPGADYWARASNIPAATLARWVPGATRAVDMLAIVRERTNHAGQLEYCVFGAPGGGYWAASADVPAAVLSRWTPQLCIICKDTFIDEPHIQTSPCPLGHREYHYRCLMDLIKMQEVPDEELQTDGLPRCALCRLIIDPNWKQRAGDITEPVVIDD